MSNWIYNWLRSKVGDGQVLVRDGHRLVGMSRTGTAWSATTVDLAVAVEIEC